MASTKAWGNRPERSPSHERSTNSNPSGTAAEDRLGIRGCHAWGETAEEALHNLDGVAADFIASYEQHGDELPPSIAAAGELVVAV